MNTSALTAPAISNSRIGRLDALRGVASLVVLAGHCSPPLMHWAWWLRPLGDGYGAVLLFFLLSGYVLALQLGSPQRPGYASFLIRRFFRIWPAFAFVLVLSFLAFHWTGFPVLGGDGGGAAGPPSQKDLLRNCLFLSPPGAIDPPVWTLFVEMRLAVVFPFLLLCVQRLGLVGASLVSLAAVLALSRVPFLAESSKYVILFALGAVMAQPQNAITRIYRRLSPWAENVGLVIAVILISYKFYPEADPAFFPGALSWPGYGLLFAVCLHSERAEKLLNRKGLLFLGRVSYGLYLVHCPLLSLISPHVPQAWLMAFVLPASLLGGWLINRFIEEPFIVLGRRLGASLGLR